MSQNTGAIALASLDKYMNGQGMLVDTHTLAVVVKDNYTEGDTVFDILVKCFPSIRRLAKGGFKDWKYLTGYMICKDVVSSVAIQYERNISAFTELYEKHKCTDCLVTVVAILRDLGINIKDKKGDEVLVHSIPELSILVGTYGVLHSY